MPAAKSPNISRELPLRAQVAFAVRCARRVVHLFRLQSGHPQLAKCCKALGSAVRFAEAFANDETIDLDELAQADERTAGAVAAVGEMDPPNTQSECAVKAVYAALCAAKIGAESKNGKISAKQAERIAESVGTARDSAAAADGNVDRHAGYDWEKLRGMDLGRFPDFGDPVDPGDKGPLGPLFQDFSRGGRSSTRPTTGGSEETRQAASIKARADQLAEIDDLRRQIEAERQQLQDERAEFDAAMQSLREEIEERKSELEEQQSSAEQRAAELAERHQEFIDREQQFAQRQAELEADLDRQEQELTNSRLQLEAEKDETHATFEWLQKERRDFFELRLGWSPRLQRP